MARAWSEHGEAFEEDSIRERGREGYDDDHQCGEEERGVGRDEGRPRARHQGRSTSPKEVQHRENEEPASRRKQLPTAKCRTKSGSRSNRDRLHKYLAERLDHHNPIVIRLGYDGDADPPLFVWLSHRYGYLVVMTLMMGRIDEMKAPRVQSE